MPSSALHAPCGSAISRPIAIRRSGGDAIASAASSHALPAGPTIKVGRSTAIGSSDEQEAPSQTIHACGSRAPGRAFGTKSRTGSRARAARCRRARAHRPRTRSRAGDPACRSAPPGSRSRIARRPDPRRTRAPAAPRRDARRCAGSRRRCTARRAGVRPHSCPAARRRPSPRRPRPASRPGCARPARRY